MAAARSQFIQGLLFTRVLFSKREQATGWRKICQLQARDYAAITSNLSRLLAVLFGSDYPFMAEAATEAMIAELKASKFLKADDLRAIKNGNARKLFAGD